MGVAWSNPPIAGEPGKLTLLDPSSEFAFDGLRASRATMPSCWLFAMFLTDMFDCWVRTGV
jgi:hypothetical protein